MTKMFIPLLLCSILWTISTLANGQGATSTPLSSQPTARCAYVANYVSNNVSAYTVDPTGRLDPVSGSPFDDVFLPANLGGGSLAADPQDDFCMLLILERRSQMFRRL